MSLRDRHDETRRKLALRNAQPGAPLRAIITVTVHGRLSVGRAAPRSVSFATDLLFGQESEMDLFRKVQDAVESTYYADRHLSRRRATDEALAAREAANAAAHEAFMRQSAAAPPNPRKRGKR
jgi:hypothetical protein